MNRKWILAIAMALVALSLVVLTGMVGQISLAQAAFAGVAALLLSKIGTSRISVTQTARGALRTRSADRQLMRARISSTSAAPASRMNNRTMPQ